MDEQNVTISKVGIIIRTIIFEMAGAGQESALTEEVAQLVCNLTYNLKETFENYDNILVDQAIILDPRFKDKQFLGEKYDATVVSLKQKLPDNLQRNETSRPNNEDKFKGLL